MAVGRPDHGENLYASGQGAFRLQYAELGTLKHLPQSER